MTETSLQAAQVGSAFRCASADATEFSQLDPDGDDVTEDEWQAAWVEEYHRRTTQIDSGDVSMISAEALIARMRATHGG